MTSNGFTLTLGITKHSKWFWGESKDLEEKSNLEAEFRKKQTKLIINPFS